MTPDELDERLDAMADAAGDDPGLQPGLITVLDDDWIKRLWEVRATTKTLDDGTRHRNIKIVIGSAFETAVLPRVAAGERGAPYRDLTPRG